jgi:acetyl-CoA acetyltransferase
MTDQAGIVGFGETPIGIFPGRTSTDLQAQAIALALQDAGLGLGDVDGLFALGPYGRPIPMFSLALTEYLGIQPNVAVTVDAGGTASVLSMIVDATRAIAAGDCTVAVCVFGENAASGLRAQSHGFTSAERIEFEEPFGIVGTVIPYALIASMYMEQYGTTAADLGAIAISARGHAARNENALRRKPLDLDTYLESRMIAEPLRLMDCSSIVDGAGALVLARSDLSRDLPHQEVRLLGAAARATHRNVGGFRSFEALELEALGRRALARAGVELADIDVATIHDAFTISTVIFLEGLGFCEHGGAGDYARSGGMDLGARCPVNTHGGLLSQGHVGGVLHFVEAVRQLRGDAGASQVDGAELAMVVGGGGIVGVNSVAVLGTAP